MSTPLVSAFYDVHDVLYQNKARSNLSRSHLALERKAVGGPVVSLNNLNNQRNTNTSPTNMTSHLISQLDQETLQMLTNEKLLNKKLDRCMSEPAGDRNGNLQKNVNSSRYKTELCRPYEESGHCKYGDKCQFAHSPNELRTLSRHPKYKTDLCRTFHTIGFCPYGPRCHFIHNEDERRLNQINQLKQREPTSPRPTQRPKALSFSVNFAAPLGSTADSPPSSFTDSPPSMSPTFLSDDVFSSLPDAFTPMPVSAPPQMSSSFSFREPPTTTTSLGPLNIQTSQIGLQAALAQLNNHRNNSLFRDSTMDVFVGPPTPPESMCGDSPQSSMCGSPLEVSRGLRLPIFSRLSISD